MHNMIVNEEVGTFFCAHKITKFTKPFIDHEKKEKAICFPPICTLLFLSL